MKKILLVTALFLSVSTWATPPKLANPLENSVEVSNILQILVYPTPYDIERKYSLYLEFFAKNEPSKAIEKILLPPVKIFDYKVDVSDWTNGAYVIKAVYVNSNHDEETSVLTRNFTLNKN